MEFCFGVDIGGTTVKIGLFQTDGTLVDKWEIPTRTDNEGEAILPDIAESLEVTLRERGIARDLVRGIGIGIPAPVKEDGIVQRTANLGWGYKEVKREAEELTGFRTAVGNDANVAALGEMWLGAGKGCKDLVMVTLGTGVGGGIIANGHPLIGAHGAGRRDRPYLRKLWGDRHLRLRKEGLSGAVCVRDRYRAACQEASAERRGAFCSAGEKAQRQAGV